MLPWVALNVGILVVPLSDAGTEMYLCAFLQPVSPVIFLVVFYGLLVFLLCFGAFRMDRVSDLCLVLLALHPKLASLQSWVNSLVHQHLDFGPKSKVGTSFCIVACSAEVSLLHLVFSSLWLLIVLGSLKACSWISSSFQNSIKSTFLKFLTTLDGALVSVRSCLVTTERWSVFWLRFFVRASHESSESKECSERNTWSSLVHFLETLCLYVGIFGGRARSKLASATMLISFSAF